MYKIIALDVNGTLLTDKKKLTTEVIEAVKNAHRAGVKIVLCTERSYDGIVKVVHDIGNQFIDYAICFNGALVKDAKTHTILSRVNLTKEDLSYLYLLSERAGCSVHFDDEHSIYTPNQHIGKYTIQEAYYNNAPLYYRNVYDLPDKFVPSKAIFSEEQSKLDNFIKKLPKEFFSKFHAIKSGPNFFEILNSTASKGNALKSLCERLNIDQQDVLAIGDHDNDLSMLSFAGKSIAMGNSDKAVLKIADDVTGTNNENGVASAIEKYILN
ncbi:MAG: Cof-type HAD-IIB family hydrolase [Carnobacterium sp.]